MVKPAEKTTLTYGINTWEVADTRTHDGKSNQNSWLRANSITDAAKDLIRTTQGAFLRYTPLGEFNFEVSLSSVTYIVEAIRPEGSMRLPWTSISTFEGKRSLVHACAEDHILTFGEWEAKQEQYGNLAELRLLDEYIREDRTRPIRTGDDLSPRTERQKIIQQELESLGFYIVTNRDNPSTLAFSLTLKGDPSTELLYRTEDASAH